MVTTAQTIPWRHLLLEGAAIVAGILLAFAIDAWWQNREQEAMDHAQLAAVLEELEANKRLLAEALAAHKSTVDEGRLLLELIAGDRSAAVDSQILQLMPRFLNFYEINVPFGALGTASQSGAIARMDHTSLARGLASWPAAIEDLLEEQRAGDDALTALLAFMTAAMPMNEILRGTLGSPTRRGVDETVAGIKRQHNVFEQLGIDPQKAFGYKILEPLIELRKDGVRKVGAGLGLPPGMFDRIPFPGPALAARVIGEVTPAKIALIKKATAITEAALKDVKAFQYLAILHEDRVTGMRNNKRVFGNQIEIRENRDLAFKEPDLEALRRTDEMRPLRAAGQTDDRPARPVIPVRRPQPHEGRDKVHSAGVRHAPERTRNGALSVQWYRRSVAAIRWSGSEQGLHVG